MSGLPALSEIPCENTYDVLVCGSGMGGITAACAASEAGLRVGLIEYFGELGGIPVNGALGSISGFSRKGVVAVAGFARQFADAINARGKGLVQNGGQNINLAPTEINDFIWELMDFYHVDVQLYTRLIAAVTDDDGHISEVVTTGKEGLRRIKAKIFLDATGDGDLAVMAGAPFAYGRESDGKVQSATLIFIVGGVDRARIPAYIDIRQAWRSKERLVPIDHNVFQFVPHNEESNEIAVNMTHSLNADPLSARGLTKIRRDCMKQAKYLLEEFFRKEIPGFEKAWISRYAPQVGIRESRRISGDYLLTEDDVVKARHFDDEIACGIWGIDAHNPDGIHTGISLNLDLPYGIPYRCITPKKLKNLLISCRAISADHIAFSSSRINSTCMAIGEAAGCAAELAIASGDVHKIDVAELKTRIAQMKYRFFTQNSK